MRPRLLAACMLTAAGLVAYLHGWRDGLERVQAIARFDVPWFGRGARLELRDVSVR